jgi:diguanylate cyclase (GGDEF)-like protein
MSSTVLESGRPFLGRLSDPQLDPVSRADLEKWGEKSCLTVPMQSIAGPMGLLNLWDKEQERTYTDGEMALAISLAELAGEAVRNAKLLRRLRSLSESDPLTGLANHRKLYEFLAHERARAERYGSHFSLVMLDVDEFKLLNDTHGHPAGDAVLRQVAALLAERTRAADIVGRYGGDEFLLVLPETTATEAGLFAQQLRAALAEEPYVTTAGEQIPIHASFGIAAYPEDAPDANGLVALADANLYSSKRRGGDAITGNEEERPLRDAEGGTFGLFESLVTAVDNKDRYTRRHSEEVTEYALAISKALGLSEDSQRVLRVASLLHDVGKIGIPDRILRKPGSLSKGEYEVVKGHPLLAETIIASIPDVEEIRAAVAAHHERYDGLGYPHGLAESAIPLLARIMAVADTYSAMTTDRPYRKALSGEEALAELRACSGTQFDPEIVETFVACIEGGEAVDIGAARTAIRGRCAAGQGLAPESRRRVCP